MSEIRKLTKTEISQAEILSSAIAEKLDEVCSAEGIENFGVIIAAFLIMLASVIIECLEEDEHEDAVRMFFEHVNNVIKQDHPDAPKIN
jgi:hypothetical protein